MIKPEIPVHLEYKYCSRQIKSISNKMVKAKKFLYAKPFEGMPKPEDFELVEEELPGLEDGEFLAEAVYLSVDPYQRAISRRLEIGDTMTGLQIARVIESKNAEFPVGKHVFAAFGWRTHTVSDGHLSGTVYPVYTVPELEGHPLSLYLGVLGMPGNTSYFGFLEICKPQAGETVVITGAGGAVGNHVGQIAKMKGCKVIGITGSDEKAEWVKTLGFDHVVNYKTTDIATALEELAPEGIDCYFDNVGGEVSSTIIYKMNHGGRVSVCGAISAYNAEDTPKASAIQWSVVANELLVKGFAASNWMDRWQVGIQQNTKWIQEGKLKYRETLTQGFQNMPSALIGVLKGDNTGKAIVKV